MPKYNQSKIGKKIKKIQSEGKPRKQAIAIALSMTSKKRKSSTKKR
jgi:hypothetical protein